MLFDIYVATNDCVVVLFDLCFFLSCCGLVLLCSQQPKRSKRAQRQSQRPKHPRFLCVFVCVFVCVYVWVCVCVYACVGVWVGGWVSVCVCGCVCGWVGECVWVCGCMCACVCVCVFVCVCVCVCCAGILVYVVSTVVLLFRCVSAVWLQPPLHDTTHSFYFDRCCPSVMCFLECYARANPIRTRRKTRNLKTHPSHRHRYIASEFATPKRTTSQFA
jgi:hypothetical protein